MTAQPLQKPWYKHPYLWLVIGIPALAVFFSLQFVWIAVKHRDAEVRDDWYEDGKTVNLSIARDEQALVLGVSAAIRFDEVTGEILVTLSSRRPIEAPTLTLHLVHSTKAEQDQHLVLQRLMGNDYRGQLDKPASGTFQIELDGKTWRLTGGRRLPAADGISLTAQ